MLLTALVGFIAAFIGSIPIAGPIAVLILERGLQGKGRDAVQIAIGAAIAESIYAGAAFAGITAVFVRFPILLPASRILGSIVLIVLGIVFARRVSKPTKPLEESTKKRAGQWPWLLGFSITALNPTLMVSWTAVTTTLHGAGVLGGAPIDGILFGVGVALGVVCWFLLFVKLVHHFRDRFSQKTLDRVVNGVGWVLLAAGIVMGIRTAIVLLR